MNRLINGVDQRGEVLGAIMQSDTVSIIDMTNATNVSLAIPDESRFAIIQNLNPAQILYAKEAVQTAPFTAIPSAGNNQELMVNPDVRQFFDGENRFIHFITNGTARIIVSFYS